jgi:hypothetical protein
MSGHHYCLLTALAANAMRSITVCMWTLERSPIQKHFMGVVRHDLCWNKKMYS